MRAGLATSAPAAASCRATHRRCCSCAARGTCVATRLSPLGWRRRGGGNGASARPPAKQLACEIDRRRLLRGFRGRGSARAGAQSHAARGTERSQCAPRPALAPCRCRSRSPAAAPPRPYDEGTARQPPMRRPLVIAAAAPHAIRAASCSPRSADSRPRLRAARLVGSQCPAACVAGGSC